MPFLLENKNAPAKPAAAEKPTTRIVTQVAKSTQLEQPQAKKAERQTNKPAVKPIPRDDVLINDFLAWLSRLKASEHPALRNLIQKLRKGKNKGSYAQQYSQLLYSFIDFLDNSGMKLSRK